MKKCQHLYSNQMVILGIASIDDLVLFNVSVVLRGE